MRIVSLLLVFSLIAVSSAQEAGREKQRRMEHLESVWGVWGESPATLAEAHVRLEQALSAELLAEIDAMGAEEDLEKYQLGLGLSMRNAWGLWADSPLAQHMRELGFTHPEGMSRVILDTFWCKRHGQDLRLAERAARAKRSRETGQAVKEETERRTQQGNAAIREMMMGVRFEPQEVPVVRIPIGGGPSVRFMCPFHDGIFLTVYREWPARDGSVVLDEDRRWADMDHSVSRGLYLGMKPHFTGVKRGDNFHTLGFHFDLKDRKVHRIHVPEVDEVCAAVAAGQRAWFAGLIDGKAVLVGVGDQDRITAPLPQTDEIPDLGLDGQFLLAVYSKTIYRFTDRTWTVIHSGDILLPRSGLPPRRHGNRVFLRDEDKRTGLRRLWWLTVGEEPSLRLLARDMGFFERIVRQDPWGMVVYLVGPPRWGETSSYCVTGDGDLWACVGNGAFLLRRSPDGRYSYAMAYNSARFGETQDAAEATGGDLHVSAITALPDNTLLLVGRGGLYRLKGDELIQELAFVADETPDSGGKVVRRLNWFPTNVVMLEDGSYCVSGVRGGVYWIRRDDNGQWACLAANEGDPVEW